MVFGFFTVFDAFGVTATTTVHEPFFRPVTRAPFTPQNFRDDVRTVTTTFDVEANFTERDASNAFAVIVFFTLTVSCAAVAATVVVGDGDVVVDGGRVVPVVPPEEFPDEESTTAAAARVTVMVYVVDETPSCAVTTTGMALAPTASEIAV